MTNVPDNSTHTALMATYIDSFFEVCKCDLSKCSTKVSLPADEDLSGAAKHEIEEQWRRAVFLEDPLNKLKHMDVFLQTLEEGTESDEAIKQALTTFRKIEDVFLPKGCNVSLSHWKPIAFITGKLPHLIDLQVIVVDKLPSDHYASKSVADWTFLVLADETGAVVGAFHNELPKSVARKVQAIPGKTKKSLLDLIKVGDVCAFTAIKTISLFGTTMVSFSTKSNVNVIGSYIQNYILDFGARLG